MAQRSRQGGTAAPDTYLAGLVDLALLERRFARLRRANPWAAAASAVIEGLLGCLRERANSTRADDRDELLKLLRDTADRLRRRSGHASKYGTRADQAEGLELWVARALDEGVRAPEDLIRRVEAWRSANDVDLLDGLPTARAAALAAIYEAPTAGTLRDQARAIAAAIMRACGIRQPSRLQDRQRKRLDRAHGRIRRGTDRPPSRP